MHESEEYTGSISDLVLLYIKKEKTGYIHSIFQFSFNIRFGENLVYISDLKKGLVSFGCCVSDRKIKKILDSIKIGDIVIKKESRLIFYTDSGVEEINLDLLKNRNLKISHVRLEKSVAMKIAQAIRNIGLENRTGIGLKESEIEKIMKKGVTEENQKYFTGRGKGLTPGGDDLLLGYSLIEKLHGKKVELIYGEFTTDISRQYFKAFNKGYVNEIFLELFKGRKNIEDTVKKITEIGHTSGYDTLLGIFLGIENNNLMEELT